MQVFEAWLIYLIVVAVVWIVLYAATCFSGMSSAAKLFIALLAGAIVVFFVLSSVESRCADDRFWFCLLMLFAFLAPLLIGLWLLWNGGWDHMKDLGSTGEPKIDRTFVCEGNDCYPVATEIKSRSGKTTILHSDI